MVCVFVWKDQTDLACAISSISKTSRMHMTLPTPMSKCQCCSTVFSKNFWLINIYFSTFGFVDFPLWLKKTRLVHISFLEKIRKKNFYLIMWQNFIFIYGLKFCTHSLFIWKHPIQYNTIHKKIRLYKLFSNVYIHTLKIRIKTLQAQNTVQ